MPNNHNSSSLSLIFAIDFGYVKSWPRWFGINVTLSEVGRAQNRQELLSFKFCPLPSLQHIRQLNAHRFQWFFNQCPEKPKSFLFHRKDQYVERLFLFQKKQLQKHLLNGCIHSKADQSSVESMEVKFYISGSGAGGRGRRRVRMKRREKWWEED